MRAKEVLVGAAVVQIRTLAFRHQQPEPILPAAAAVPVLEHIRLLADAIDGLWGSQGDLTYRYGVCNDWQRQWMRETLAAEGLDLDSLLASEADENAG